MKKEVRRATHEMLDACIDRSEAGTEIFFKFTPHVKWIEWYARHEIARCIKYESTDAEEIREAIRQINGYTAPVDLPETKLNWIEIKPEHRPPPTGTIVIVRTRFNNWSAGVVDSSDHKDECFVDLGIDDIVLWSDVTHYCILKMD